MSQAQQNNVEIKNQIQLQRSSSNQNIIEKQINESNEQKKQQNKKQTIQDILEQLQQFIKTITIEINSIIHQPNNSSLLDIEPLITKLIIKQKIFHLIKEQISKECLPNQETKVEQKMEKQSQNQNQIKQKQSFSQKISNQALNHAVFNIMKVGQNYVPTIAQINERKSQFQQQQNDDGWTDATQSDAGQLDLDDIIVVDDELIQQMHMSDEQEGEQKMEQEEGNQQQDEVDLEQLQQQFTKGQQSNQQWVFGNHSDKFCVSINGSLDKSILVSGGGDDKMLIYSLDCVKNWQKQQKQEKKMVQEQLQKLTLLTENKKNENLNLPIHIVNHSQTVTKIQFSYDKEFIFSLTQKQLLCTSTKNYQTQKIQIDSPKDFCCHKFGGVFAVSLGYNIQIYNIKGFKHYDTYCLDQEISSFMFTQNGKQIVAACDNKLRIVTPKTSQIVKVTGNQFHHGQITSMCLSTNTIFTGCIDGFVYASNLTKGQVLGSITGIGATINNLQFADNYLIVGPSQNILYWYDSNKLKKIFQNKLKGSSSSIIQLTNKNVFAVGDLKGQIHLLDKRNPLKEDRILKAGNTVHQMWNQNNFLSAACEDGKVRMWDLRKYLN